MGNEAYHHGQTIRKYRELRKWTQRALAEKWIKADGSIGVDIRYVQMIEAGDRCIASFYVLHKLCDLLDIPRWEFGLSEYNPFDQSSRGKHLYSETLDIIELLLHQSLTLWLSNPLPAAEQSNQEIMAFLDSFSANAPPMHLERRLLMLRAHCQGIEGLIHLDSSTPEMAFQAYQDMHAVAQNLNDPALAVHSLTILAAAEVVTRGNSRDAVTAMEEARDHSFSGSKQLAAYANGSLAYAYATGGDIRRFERAINTAINLAEALGDAYGDGTDFVHQKPRDIILFRSSGYVTLGEPQKALSLLPKVGDHLHVCRASAHFALKDIEACIDACRSFFAVTHKPPHQTRCFRMLLKAIDSAYGDLLIVKQFKEELREM